MRPCPTESVNFDTTENLIIEGDNLEVLKLLQKSYLGKVKMIYIDPPYNTGNDFIYPDNYTESLQTYLEYTGQVDAEGQEVRHKHRDRWPLSLEVAEHDVSAPVPRAESAARGWRNLHQHRRSRSRQSSGLMCNEVFGEENFIAQCRLAEEVCAEERPSDTLSDDHEYIVVYAREADRHARSQLLPRTRRRWSARYDNPDNDPRGAVELDDFAASATMTAKRIDPIYCRDHGPRRSDCGRRQGKSLDESSREVA